MGVRLYNAEVGRFLSVDPVEGGNANASIYPDDPVNRNDTTGRTNNVNGHVCTWSHCDLRMSNKKALILADRMEEGAAKAAIAAAITTATGSFNGVGAIIGAFMAAVSGYMWWFATRIYNEVNEHHRGIFIRIGWFPPECPINHQ